MICSKCKRTINEIFEKPYGTKTEPLCSDCAGEEINTNAPAEGTKCQSHPEIDAEFLCHRCGAPVCKTCAFAFENNIYICPSCVDKPQELSKSQRKSLLISYIMAGVSTLGYILIIIFAANTNNYDPKAFAALIGFMVILVSIVPAIIGLSKSVGARFRKRKNPAYVKGAIIWNGILLGYYLLSMIVGQFIK